MSGVHAPKPDVTKQSREHEHAFAVCCSLCLAEKAVTKRQVAGPRPSYTLENVQPETITAIPYDIIKEGLQG